MDNDEQDRKRKGPVGLLNNAGSIISRGKSSLTNVQQLVTQVATSNAKWYIAGGLIFVLVVYFLFF